MQPQFKTVRINDIDLAYVERGRPDSATPTLVFVHATGFHARVWDYIINAFDGYHIIAIDQRGHGRSSSVAVTHWRTFGEDLAAFAKALRLQNAIGVGHSMGAHALIDGAASSAAFSRLLLLDPTVADPAAYADAPQITADTPLHPAAKRRNRFSSPDAMIEQLAGKSSFPLFVPQILRDYCEHGLVQVQPGDYQLACPPEVEAHVYTASRSNGAVYNSVRKLQIPVRILRAKLPADAAVHDFSSSPTWPGLVNEFANASELHLADCSHFIPMQMPDTVIQAVAEAIDGWQAGSSASCG